MTTASTGSQPRFDVYEPSCPARRVLEHVTSRWGVLALGVLAERTHRFAELRRRLPGVSEKVLTETLRALERDGFVIRTVLPGPAPHVEYRLADQGAQAARLLGELVGWLEHQMPQIQSHQARHDARRSDIVV